MVKVVPTLTSPLTPVQAVLPLDLRLGKVSQTSLVDWRVLILGPRRCLYLPPSSNASILS